MEGITEAGIGEKASVNITCNMFAAVNQKNITHSVKRKKLRYLFRENLPRSTPNPLKLSLPFLVRAESTCIIPGGF